MNSALQRDLPGFELPAPPPGSQRMYAIAFDLVVEELRKHYDPVSPNNAYTEVREFLVREGFSWRQGSVYFGDPARINMSTCVEAAQRLARELPWFTKCVRDIRMLRIEELSDLLGIVERAAELSKH